MTNSLLNYIDNIHWSNWRLAHNHKWLQWDSTHTFINVAEKPNFLLHVNLFHRIFFSNFIASLVFMFILIKGNILVFHSSVCKCFDLLWFDFLEFTSYVVKAWPSFSYNYWYTVLSVSACSWLWSQWGFFGAFIRTVSKLFWGYNSFLIWQARLLLAFKLLIYF